jgi:adenylyltransferase/sulfurtransferase
MVNDACVFEKKLNVYGSIFRFDGQSTVFCDPEGPCYRCLYPEPPPPGMVPSCAEGGVLGILPGIIGVMQATEAIKLIIGKGTPLVGRLLLYDALQMKFRELKIRKDPSCPVCSPTRPSPTAGLRIFLRHRQRHQAGRGEEDSGPVRQATGQADQEMLDEGRKVTLLDVREPQEWDITHIEGAKNIPLGSIPERMNELDTADDIVVYCHHGTRSAQAIKFLKKMGFEKLQNMAGGIDAWAINVDKDMPRY